MSAKDFKYTFYINKSRNLRLLEQLTLNSFEMIYLDIFIKVYNVENL